METKRKMEDGQMKMEDEDTDKDNIPGKLTYFTSFPENYWTYKSL